MALSQVVNVPHRGLGRKEFTAIRKLAREKNMTMYQVDIDNIKLTWEWLIFPPLCEYLGVSVWNIRGW